MSLEKLRPGDHRLVIACVVISIVSLFVGVKYYFLAFPEASIEFRVTRESSAPLATSFLEKMRLDASRHRHAAIFDFDNEQKTFLERELGVAESNQLLETTVRLWRWKHRWFRSLEKEEMGVEVTTKGEVVGFHHLLPEEAEGDDLAAEEARSRAEAFLVETMGRPLESLSFVEASTQKRPHRTDHSFTWKVVGSEVRGADYRVDVDVAGSDVAGYLEYLKVPDAWTRDYEKLRSKNEVTGQIDSVLLLLTVLAMMVYLVLRIRRGDVRWKAASILGAVMFVLLGASQLNSLPSELFAYDTTTSFGGFLTGKVLAALAVGLGGGVVIFLLSASGEPFYRERFPKMLSLTSLLRPRALRSREFFVASLTGITLTCFFFAYENVFYIIANSMGAWAPRDVAYSDLLSTAFPWVFVLFFGFFPAISEEFISRMFSIPFFEKIMKSTAAAIVVAAFIWGFGHAAYPNQPFWIRGLEVGLAGIVFGLVMLRFGIASVVICHFSVDALYTAFVLIRSPNLYYRISGSLSAGIWLLLFLVSAFLYLRKGGFLPDEQTNEAEGVAPPPEPAALAAAAAPTASVYHALPRSRIVGGLVLGALLAAIGLVPVRSFGDWVRFGTTRETAREVAGAFLRDNGFDVSTYRSAVQILDRTDEVAAAYLVRNGSPGVVEKFYETLAPTPLWRVRFFVPGQKEEFWASVDTTTGTVVGFSRIVAEDAAGATVPKERALELARTFLEAHGVDPSRGELKEQTEKDEKARRDHTLLWELPEPGAGEAKVRQQVVVQGDAVGSWTREVKIPEDWRRDREKETIFTVLLRWLKLPFLATLGVFAVLLLVAKIRGGEIPWKLALLAGALPAVTTPVRTALSLDALWSQYQTSIPAGSFLVVILVAFVVGAIGSLAAGVLLVGFAGALVPRAATMFRRENRRLLARDALLAGFVALGVALALPIVTELLQVAIPSGRLIEGVSWPSGVETTSPFLFALAGLAFSTLFVSSLGGIVAGIVTRYFRSTLARGLLAAAFVISFLPSSARTLPEVLVGALDLAIATAVVVVLIRFFLRDNPLAWVWSVWFALGCNAAIRLLEIPAYRTHGALLLAVVLGSAVWLYLGSRRGLAPPSSPA